MKQKEVRKMFSGNPIEWTGPGVYGLSKMTSGESQWTRLDSMWLVTAALMNGISTAYVAEADVVTEEQP